MKNIKMKNLLAENMRRFGTKNLSEQSANVPADGTAVQILRVLRKLNIPDDIIKKEWQIDQQELDRLTGLLGKLQRIEDELENEMTNAASYPVTFLATVAAGSAPSKLATLILQYGQLKYAPEIAIVLQHIKNEKDAQMVSTYIKNQTKMNLYEWIRSRFSLIKLTTSYAKGDSIIGSLRRLNQLPVPGKGGTTNLSEQNATEPKRLKLLLMYKDGPQKGKTARQIDVLYGYKNAIKPSSLGAVFNFEIAETAGPSGGFLGRYVCRSGKIEVLTGSIRPVGSTSPQLAGIYMISAKAKELMEAITGCSDYAFNDTDVSTTNYV